MERGDGRRRKVRRHCRGVDGDRRTHGCHHRADRRRRYPAGHRWQLEFVSIRDGGYLCGRRAVLAIRRSRHASRNVPLTKQGDRMFCVKAPGARGRLVALALGFALLAPSALRAQNLSFGSINGTVTDTSGGALPGVTVTASSPALQVGLLSAVSDGAGKYQIVDLPRGTYEVRFELQGFQLLIRKDIQLTAGFRS